MQFGYARGLKTRTLFSSEFHNLEHGQTLICMDSQHLQEELGSTRQNIESVRQVGLVRPTPQKPPPPKIRVNCQPCKSKPLNA